MPTRHHMTTSNRLALFICLAIVLHATRVDAIPITVAEFRWEATLIPGTECTDPTDLECVPTDPISQSLFSLTGLWDDASTAAPTLGGIVTFAGGSAIPWLDITLDAGYFDQFLVDGLPLSAATTILFDFLGQTISLDASLVAPGFAVLSFDSEATTPPTSVPEPTTLGLLGIGLLAFARSRLRRNRSNHVPAR
jgi:hypothetical protein